MSSSIPLLYTSNDFRRDVNTRFSGITLEQLDKAVMDIQAVRSAALMFIGPDTVLVGHGSVWDRTRAPRVR